MCAGFHGSHVTSVFVVAYQMCLCYNVIKANFKLALENRARFYFYD